MITNTTKRIFEKYQEKSMEYNDILQTLHAGDPASLITTLIADYQAYKELLAMEEYERDNLTLVYDDDFVMLKDKYLEEGMKSTEAKEHARTDLKGTRLNLIKHEKNISILKACIHSTEYQLRLMYQIHRRETGMDDVQFTIQDILEAR